MVYLESGILSTRKLTINVQKEMWHHHLSIAIMWLDYHQCGSTTNGVLLLFICPTGAHRGRNRGRKKFNRPLPPTEYTLNWAKFKRRDDMSSNPCGPLLAR
jgi:hypothetical protein